MKRGWRKPRRRHRGDAVAHLNVAIISLSQDMDLNNGTMANFMLIRLPNAKIIRALIEEDAAQEIVSLVLGGRATTGEAEAPSDDDSIDLNGSVRFNPPVGDLPADSPELPAPPKRPRQVAKDDLGYPVLRSDDAVEPRDEDGVGQV